MTKPNITPELIRAALAYLSPDLPRDEWAAMAMALKSEFDDSTGFELFDQWSQGSESYQAASSKATWRSVNASGGISIGTLLKLAQDAGFDLPKLSSDTPKPSVAQLAALAAEKKASAQRERERTEAAHLATAAKATKRWQAASDSPLEGTTTYLSRKGVKAYGLRFEAGGTALVPLRDGERDGAGKLWNVQALASRKPPVGSDKLFMKDGRKAGLWHMLGATLEQPDSEQKQPLPGIESAQAATIFIAEGYATAASVHEATGQRVACAFDAGNLVAVAKALRALHPSARLLIAGDDDHATQAATGRNAGREKAEAAAKAVQGVAIFPADLLTDESDFNDLHARLGIDAVREQLMSAIENAAPKGDTVSPFAENAKNDTKGFKMNPLENSAGAAIDAPTDSDKAPYEDKRFDVSDSGVWFTGFDDKGRVKPPLKLCSRLDVSAGVRDYEGGGFGYLLEFDDPLGNRKSWPMPARMLSGDGNEYRSALLNMGLRIEPGSAIKSLLSTYIQSRQPTAWAHCTDRAGWHNSEGRAVYVQPRHTFGDSPEHRVIYQSDSGIDNNFLSAGTLDQWRSKVAALCVGNTRLAFAVSSAFAGMAMSWIKSESGGFHLRGDSSSGKTTALRVAASVFGGDSFMRRWRATDNAIEAIAAQHCDALLVLDELAQVDPKQAGDMAYLLGNSVGKARANRSALPKPLLRWNLLFLSAGEVGLAQHVAESGKRVRAGQEVRMVDMPADTGVHGAFESLHAHESASAFSDAVTTASKRWHGTAAPAFIEHLIAQQEGLSARMLAAVDAVAAQMIPEAASGQVQRVGRRFALVAAAGELATQAGITGWPEGEATQAARKCFEAWLSARGGLGNAEEYQVFTQIRRYFQQNGEGQFKWMHRALDDHAVDKGIMSGFRRLVGAGGKSIRSNAEHQRQFGERISDADAHSAKFDFVIYPEAFKDVVCNGFDSNTGLRLLREKGILDAESDTRFTKKVSIPGLGDRRMIVIKSSILADDAE